MALRRKISGVRQDARSQLFRRENEGAQEEQALYGDTLLFMPSDGEESRSADIGVIPDPSHRRFYSRVEDPSFCRCRESRDHLLNRFDRTCNSQRTLMT